MRRLLWMLPLILSLRMVFPALAQTPVPATPTFVNGRVLLNGSVILDPATDAPGCPDLFRLNYALDGQHFFVVLNCANRSGNEAFVFRVDGSDKRHLTGAHDLVVADRIRWSPDSQLLIYERSSDLTGAPQHGEPENGLVRYDIQSGNKLMLLARASFNAAVWSPDGRYLAYAVDDQTADRTDIWLLRSDGSGLWALESVATSDLDAQLTWTTDPLTLTYVSPKVLTEVDTQISEQPAASLGEGWKTVAPHSPFYVTAVANDDTLNVRSGPGINNGILAKLAPDASDIVLTGQAQDIGASHWIEVTFAGGKGWVNRKFLLPQLPADAATPISVRTLATG